MEECNLFSISPCIYTPYVSYISARSKFKHKEGTVNLKHCSYLLGLTRSPRISANLQLQTLKTHTTVSTKLLRKHRSS